MESRTGRIFILQIQDLPISQHHRSGDRKKIGSIAFLQAMIGLLLHPTERVQLPTADELTFVRNITLPIMEEGRNINEKTGNQS